MSLTFPQLNLIAAWAGLWLGFASGLGLGLKFHREDWLGGYGSFQRRLYRLGHISFFGLGAVNWMFYGTVQWAGLGGGLAGAAGWAFLAGAATMPVCCLLMAHWPRARLLFAVPVLSLLAGASLTLWELQHTLHEPTCLLSRPAGTLSSARSGGEGWGEEVRFMVAMRSSQTVEALREPRSGDGSSPTQSRGQAVPAPVQVGTPKLK